MENYIELINRTMVEKFLSWKLPKDFNPDCGISFERQYVLNKPIYEPVGTNLFTADQAKAMFEYCAKEILEEIINDLDERNNTQAIYIDNHMTRVAELEKENKKLKNFLRAIGWLVAGKNAPPSCEDMVSYQKFKIEQIILEALSIKPHESIGTQNDFSNEMKDLDFYKEAVERAIKDIEYYKQKIIKLEKAIITLRDAKDSYHSDIAANKLFNLIENTK